MTMQKKISKFISNYKSADKDEKKRLELYAFRHQMRWNAVVQQLTDIKTKIQVETEDESEQDEDY